MIARLEAAGMICTQNWTVAEGDVCACGHHRQEHAPFASIKEDPHVPVGSQWRAEGSTRCEACTCPAFNGIGSGGSHLTDDARKKYALADLEGVLSADVVLLLAANDKGASGSWVELGVALAARRRDGRDYSRPFIIVAGPKNKRTIFTELADVLAPDDEAGFRAVIARQVHVAGGLTLPGWTCWRCHTFNGEAKEQLSLCRGCGEKSPGQPRGLNMGKKTNAAVARAPVGLTPEEQATQDHFANGSETFHAAPPPDAQKKVSRETPHCVACGHYHGSINGEVECMRRMIVALRLRLRLFDVASPLLGAQAWKPEGKKR